jgi:hypothetical protein
MSVCHYKFKNAVDYSSITFNGPFISLSSLRDQIGAWTPHKLALSVLIELVFLLLFGECT